MNLTGEATQKAFYNFALLYFVTFAAQNAVLRCPDMNLTGEATQKASKRIAAAPLLAFLRLPPFP
jgi:hypothetical protein